MIGRSWCYLAACYLAVAPPCAAERLLPPRNLSYVWLDPFNVTLRWRAPSGPSCPGVRYEVRSPGRSTRRMPNLYTNQPLVGLRSDTTFSVKTIGAPQGGPCLRQDDSPVVSIVIPRQVALVLDFQFSLYPPCEGPASCRMEATWTQASDTAGLQMLYRSCSGHGNLSVCQVIPSGGRRHACRLEGQLRAENVCIVFQGSYGGGAKLNQTFMGTPRKSIRTLPPIVAMAQQGHWLNVSWHHVTVGSPSFWEYRVNYSECGRLPRAVLSDKGVNSMLLPFDKDCRYELQVQPQFDKDCGVALADISALLVYNDWASPDQSAVIAMVVVPAFLSMVVLVLCCYIRRKRKDMYTNIPVPPSALQEMMSSHPQRQPQLIILTPEKVDLCVVSPPPQEKKEKEREEDEEDLLMLEVT